MVNDVSVHSLLVSLLSPFLLRRKLLTLYLVDWRRREGINMSRRLRSLV